MHPNDYPHLVVTNPAVAGSPVKGGADDDYIVASHRVERPVPIRTRPICWASALDFVQVFWRYGSFARIERNEKA